MLKSLKIAILLQLSFPQGGNDSDFLAKGRKVPGLYSLEDAGKKLENSNLILIFF